MENYNSNGNGALKRNKKAETFKVPFVGLKSIMNLISATIHMTTKLMHLLEGGFPQHNREISFFLPSPKLQAYLIRRVKR